MQIVPAGCFKGFVKTPSSVDCVVRAVVLPVAAPVDISWREFEDAVNPSFRMATDLANWAVRRMFTIDDHRSRAKPKCIVNWPGNKEFLKTKESKIWINAKQSACCIIRSVWKEYKKHREKVIFHSQHYLLSKKYPQPFPVHNQAWNLRESNGSMIVDFPLPGCDRIHLRLRTGRDFVRQTAMARMIVNGTVKQGEMSIRRNRKGEYLITMIGHFPIQERKSADRVCFLHTDANALLVAEIDGRSVTVTNGDHIRQALMVMRSTVERHARYLQRIGEDKKREVRMDEKQRHNLNIKVTSRCEKQSNRVDTIVKQIAAQVVRLCERQRVGVIVYDDTIRDFFPDGFQWFALKKRIQDVFTGEMGGGWVDGQSVRFGSEREKEAWLTNIKAARATALAGKRAVTHTQREGSHPAVTVPKKFPKSMPE